MKTTLKAMTLVSAAAFAFGGCQPDDEDVTSATHSSTSSTSSTSTTTATLGGSDGESASSSTTTTTTTTTTATTDTSETDTTTDTEDVPMECGNGIVEGLEECDLGPENADDNFCTTLCTNAVCGDGLLQEVAGEQCDNGEELNNDQLGCLEACIKATCGDGHVWVDIEECDDGENNQAGVYGKCDPITCEKGPHCGDNIVQDPQEECDQGEDNGIPGGPCSSICSLAGNMVFVTSASFLGKIGDGGVEAADAACIEAAANAKIANAQAFRAWISDDTNSPSTWNPKPEGPFILRNTTIIATSWDDLTDGELTAPIDVLETHEKVNVKPFYAWTGTKSDGTPAEDRCSNWSTTSKPYKGERGQLAKTDAAWSTYGAAECQFAARLICIEQ